MRIRRITLGLAFACLTLAGPMAGSAFAAESAADQTSASACAGHWPRTVQGTPVQWRVGGRAGDYIWHDSRGWHLRVTHVGSNLAVFSGRIVSAAPMTVTGYRLEGRDRFALSADRKVLTYRFTNYGHADGLDFRVGCSRSVSFGGSLNGTRLPVGRIWVGHDGRHPLQNPFVIRRVP
jgi:hypothetical protein